MVLMIYGRALQISFNVWCAQYHHQFVGATMAGRPFRADPVDVLIGQMIVSWRRKLGLSQKDLAQNLGVTFQQVQKYETAGNRVSASALYRIAKAMGISITSLLGEVEKATEIYDKKTREIINQVCRMTDDDKNLILRILHRLTAK